MQFQARFISLIATLVALASPAPADPPASQPGQPVRPQLGRISGAIQPADQVKTVRCIDRQGNLAYGVEWSGKAGRFSVADLAPGRTYDFEIDATDGRTFIGVDLSYEEDPLLKLAREQMGDADAPGPLTDEDRKSIDQVVTKVETFHDRQRIVHLRGDHSQASAVVELLRTREFHSGKAGEWIRRVEVWHFKFQHGGWEKIANAERVLSRVRAPRAAIEKRMAREVYLPELGGIRVETGKLDVSLDVKLPAGNAATTQAAAT